MTKYTKHAPIIEPLLIYACAYLAYLTAEWIQVNKTFNLQTEMNNPVVFDETILVTS